MSKPMTNVIDQLWAFSRRVTGNLMLVAVFLVIGIALRQFHASTSHPSESAEQDGLPGSGMVTRYEVMDLWLPESLIEKDDRGLPTREKSTHENLKSFLEQRGMKDVWYVVSIRGHQVNHRYADTLFIRYPYRQPENFLEFQAVMATVAGNPPDQTFADFSETELHIVSEGMSHHDWLNRKSQ